MLTVESEVQQLLFERRLLSVVSIVTFLGVIAWVAALASDYWIIVVAENPKGYTVENDENSTQTFLWSHSGLWRKCIVFGTKRVEDQVTDCSYHLSSDSESDAAFIQAEVSICVLALLLICLSAGFSIYSLKHPRYTFKRIAAALHFFTAISLLTLVQLVKSEFHVEQATLSHNLPSDEVLEQAMVYYGYSYLIAWCVFLIFLVSSCAFCAASRKRKLLPFDNIQYIK